MKLISLAVLVGALYLVFRRTRRSEILQDVIEKLRGVRG